jgi:VIT1/CCC1 family predicted Fe2+/Mn2+ transporter
VTDAHDHVPRAKVPTRWLDPIDRFSEALFGLIMVLGFTSSVSAATGGTGEIREILVGAISCNVAWGIVDAVMYVLSCISERGREMADFRALHAAKDPARAREILASTLPDAVRETIRPEHLDDLLARMLRRGEPRASRVVLEDFLGAVSVFVWVNVIAIPVILPFAFMNEAHTALRVSNAIAIVMLFVGGFLLARASGGRPLRTGIAMVAVGLVLVGITIALGG